MNPRPPVHEHPHRASRPASRARPTIATCAERLNSPVEDGRSELVRLNEEHVQLLVSARDVLDDAGVRREERPLLRLETSGVDVQPAEGCEVAALAPRLFEELAGVLRGALALLDCAARELEHVCLHRRAILTDERDPAVLGDGEDRRVARRANRPERLDPTHPAELDLFLHNVEVGGSRTRLFARGCAASS